MTNSGCSEIIVQKENQKVNEFLDQCAGHCLNAIVKDKNVDCFFYINFIIEKRLVHSLHFLEQLQVSPLQYDSIQDNI